MESFFFLKYRLYTFFFYFGSFENISCGFSFLPTQYFRDGFMQTSTPTCLLCSYSLSYIAFLPSTSVISNIKILDKMTHCRQRVRKQSSQYTRICQTNSPGKQLPHLGFQYGFTRALWKSSISYYFVASMSYC